MKRQKRLTKREQRAIDAAHETFAVEQYNLRRNQYTPSRHVPEMPDSVRARISTFNLYCATIDALRRNARIAAMKVY